jgi:hypothetical protein
MKNNQLRLAAVLRTAVFVLFSLLAEQTANGQTLSPAARVSLITVSPGSELYSSFGHTAIRVIDPVASQERIFGWGTFDFTTDNFYVKFLRGTLPYTVSITDMYSMQYGYQIENRSIREQVLDLTPAQRQRLFDLLNENYQPENRTYQYKFYYDNCATRPRDKIAEACGDSLRIPSKTVMTGKSYRDWMNDYLGQQPWAKVGMNLALGTPADVKTTGWQAMYLPDQLHDQLARATLVRADGSVVPLVAQNLTPFEAPKVFRQELPFIFDPEVVFAVIGIGVALFTVRRYQRGRVDRWLDRLLFGLSGFFGWFLFLLWVATDHGVTAWNPTLLYLMPLHLPLVYWATGPSTTARRRTLYFGTTAVLILLGMFLSKVPGGVDVLFPLTLLVRCIVNLQPVLNRRQIPARVA